MSQKKNYLFMVFAFALAILPAQAGAITGTSGSATGTKPYSQEEMMRLKQQKNEQLQKEREELLRKKEELMLQKRASTTDLRMQYKNATGTATSVRPEIREKIKDTRETFRENMKDAREETKEKMKDVREEFRSEIGEAKKARAHAFFERTMRRLEAAFDRLDGLADRIASRITKLEEVNKNINTTEAKQLLSTAETKITDGRNLLTQLPAQFSAIFASTTASSTVPAKLEALKGSVQNVTDAARAAHAALVDAVQSIKAQGGTSTPPTTATSTATTTGSN